MMQPARALPILALSTTLAALPLAAQPTGPPRVSPMSEISQVVGVSKVSIVYSRPSVRGRTIFGEVVPYGEVWRTGANEATRLSLSHDARMAGHQIEAGDYALFTIPQVDEWTVILNRVAEQWGAFRRDPEQDVLRFKVKPRAAEFRESLTIAFTGVASDSVTVSLRWAEVAIPFEIQFDVVTHAVEAARKFVASAKPEESRQVWNWANYCYQNEVNTEEAAGWAHRVAELAPSYWTHALHARLLARAGRTNEAVAAGEAALARAEEEAEQRGVAADSETLAGEVEDWKAGGGA